MTMKKEGFEAQRRPGVVLDAGTEAVIDAPLKVGAVSTTVEVTGGAPVIEPSRVSTGRTIDHAEVDNLPLTSRNPYNFLLFQPGISGHPNPELGDSARGEYQRPGQPRAVSAGRNAGYRERPVRSAAVRHFRQLRARDADRLQQFRSGVRPHHRQTFTTPSRTPARTLFTASFTSSAGRRDGARTPFCWRPTSVNPGIDLHDYSMNAGGAIKKDKLFIFGAYEHLLRGTPEPVTITPANATSDRAPAVAAGHRRNRAARAVPGPARRLEHQFQEPVLCRAITISATSIRSTPTTAV